MDAIDKVKLTTHFQLTVRPLRAYPLLGGGGVVNELRQALLI